MTEQAMSPLRRRMIEDMLVRNLTARTQQNYVEAIKGFAAFLKRSPDTASFEDVRRYLVDRACHVGPASRNQTVSALRFFFAVTLGRPEIVDHTAYVHQPRPLPVVLSSQEVTRLLEATCGLKYRAALGVAYGAGLRAKEVCSLKVSDIDSERMLIRVQRGKGRKDRYVMLSPRLLDLLRVWWKVERPRGWLFPGRPPTNPMSYRQLHKACKAAARLAGLDKPVSLHTLRHSFATHLLEQNVDIRVIQVLLGHANLDTTTIYTHVAKKTISAVVSPLEQLDLKPMQGAPPA